VYDVTIILVIIIIQAMLCIHRHYESVCPSAVTSRHCTKMAKHRITQTTQHDSPGTLVSATKDLREITTGSPPTAAPNKDRIGWLQRFSTNILLYIKTVQDRDTNVVTMELTCALSNGTIFSDLQWLLTTPNHHFFILCIVFCWSPSWMELVTSNLVDRLIVASASSQMTKQPWKGRGQVTWTSSIVMGTKHISVRLKLERSRFVHR